MVGISSRVLSTLPAVYDLEQHLQNVSEAGEDTDVTHILCCTYFAQFLMNQHRHSLRVSS